MPFEGQTCIPWNAAIYFKELIAKGHAKLQVLGRAVREYLVPHNMVPPQTKAACQHVWFPAKAYKMLSCSLKTVNLQGRIARGVFWVLKNPPPPPPPPSQRKVHQRSTGMYDWKVRKGPLECTKRSTIAVCLQLGLSLICHLFYRFCFLAMLKIFSYFA